MAAADGGSVKRPASGDATAAESPSKRARATVEAAEAAEAELAKGVAELKQKAQGLQELEAAGGTSASALTALAALLRRLVDLPVSADTLRRTGAGREVNQKWIRCHPDEGIRNASQALVHGWKAAAGAEKASASPAAAGKPQQGAVAAAPAAEKAPKVEARKEKKEKQESPKEARNEKKEKQEKPKEEARKEKKEKQEKPKEEAKAKDEATAPSETANGDSGRSAREALVALFKELAGFEFKRKHTFQGVAYQKVSTALKDMLDINEEISSVDQVKHLPGVGKASKAKIAEFLETGTMKRLERYRKGDFDGED